MTMKWPARAALLVAFGLGGLGSAQGQSVKLVEGDTDIIPVKTALNHLTVLEVNGPVVKVATGSPLFTIERQGNKVFVQPLRAGARTNLFIWTTTHRFNYSLEVVEDVADMHFAVQEPRILGAGRIPSPEPAGLSAVDQQQLVTKTLLALMGSTAIRHSDNLAETVDGVAVLLTNYLRVEGKIYLSYFIRNNSAEPYSLTAPEVLVFNQPDLPEALEGVGSTQLGEKEAARILYSGTRSLEVFHSEQNAIDILPGQEVIGVVGLAASGGDLADGTVVQLRFGVHLEAVPVATVIL